MENNNNSNGFKNFLASTAGYYTLSIIIAVILWGIIFALWTSATEVGMVVVVICAIFGWIALNKIQPSMFLWMSWVGWVIYFVLKFMLSALIGMFVAPFKIGRWIANAIQNSIV